MSKFLTIKLVVAAILVAFIILTVMLIFVADIGFKPKDMVTFNRYLKSIEYDDDSAFIHFYNDEMEYRYNECCGVPVSCLEVIEIGEQVEITVFEDYLDYSKVIIHKLSMDGVVLFDHLEMEVKEKAGYKIITATVVLATLAIMLLCVLLANERPQNTKESFCFCYPRPYYFISFAFTVASLLTSFMFLVVSLSGIFMEKDMALFSIVFLPFAFLGGCLTILLFWEKTTFEDMVFVVRRPFRKTCTFSIYDVKHVEIWVMAQNLKKILFFNKEGKIIFKYGDVENKKMRILLDVIDHKKLEKKIMFGNPPNTTRKRK